MSIDIKMFLKDCRSRGLTDHTIATYKSNIATFLNFVGNPLDVDTSILCKFLNYLKEEMIYKRGKITKKGVHPKTVKAYFAAISTFYDYLVFSRQLAINPIPSFTRRYLSRIKQQYNGDNSRQIISIEQMRHVINLDMPIQDKAILMILAKTGIRRGELLSIDLSDINLEKKEIVLKPKAKRTNRLVFFDDEISQVLRLFLEWRKTRAKTDALFISPLGSRLHKDDPNEIVARYGSRSDLHDPAGSLNQKLTPHCFRHWFTTHLRRAGLPREFIQELRGDRRKDAIDIYDHIDLKELKDRYLKCIPGLLEAPPALQASDLEPYKTGGHKVTPGGLPDRSKAILSLLATDKLTISQVARLLKDNYSHVKKAIYRNLKNGDIQKDELDRYFLTSKGYSKLDGIPSDLTVYNQNLSGVKVSPDPEVKVSHSLKVAAGRFRNGVKLSPDHEVKVSHGQRVTGKNLAEGVTVRNLAEVVTVSQDQKLPEIPSQKLSEIPDRQLPEIPSQKLSEIPDPRLPEIPIQRLPQIPNKRGRPKHIIQGFTLALYGYIKVHEGVSVSTISKYFLKNKDTIKPKLSRLKDYGLIINDGGNWYPTSKEPMAEPHIIKINSTGRPEAILIEG